MTVHLVGSGPGTADLLTVRAARLLATADVVVLDRLVDPSVVALIRPEAERIDVGKMPGRSDSQGLIDDLLVSLGRHYETVVRLKGGDPFVFGRGGEEAVALEAAGVPYEIVPGVSSAFAAPASAGIPVTHRGVSAAVTVVTGHAADDGSPVNWDALARVGGTIVVLMGVARRASIAHALIAAGLDPATPVAVIESAWTEHDREIRTTLDALGDADVRNPAVIVIGAVAGFALNGTWATLTRTLG